MVPSPGTSGGPGQGSMARRAGRWFRTASSPAKLRAAAAITVLLAVLLSIGGWYSVQHRSSAIDDAAAAAQQLIRVQDVRVLVVEADSLASRAYLSGGEEDPAERAEYEQAIADASRELVQVATAATAADAQLLQDASAQLAVYVGLVEQARSNNRQGFPVGTAYLGQARSVLTSSIVPAVRTVEAQARHRVDESIASAHRSSWLLLLSSLLLVAAVGAGGLWMAARFRRLINVPLAVAGVLALAVLAGGAGVNASAMGDADDVVSSSLSSADVLAQARAAAFDARSNEALTLVYRGNGQRYADQWGSARSIVDAALAESCESYGDGCDAVDAFADYVRGYESVRELDDSGAWEVAVALSTTGATDVATGVATGVVTADPVAPFERFAEQSGNEISERSAAAAAGFDDAVSSLGALSWLILLAGVLVAVLAVVGYGQRLREYR